MKRIQGPTTAPYGISEINRMGKSRGQVHSSTTLCSDSSHFHAIWSFRQHFRSLDVLNLHVSSSLCVFASLKGVLAVAFNITRLLCRAGPWSETRKLA